MNILWITNIPFPASSRLLGRQVPTLPASMGGNKTPFIETNILHNPNDISWVKQHHAMVSSGKKFDAYETHPPDYLRRLTVREAARIQGFPDNFEFSGPQSQQYKQIGNAVPTRLAYHVAKTLRACINNEVFSNEPEQKLLFSI